MAVVRGNAMYVGGAVFSDEVCAAVEDTRRGPIMLLRSSGFLLFRHWVVGAGGTCPGYVGLMLSIPLIGVLVTGHGR